MFTANHVKKALGQPYSELRIKVSDMSVKDLQTVWECLRNMTWTADDMYNQQYTMDEWAEAVYQELQNKLYHERVEA